MSAPTAQSMERFTLPNGLRVVAIRRGKVPLVAVRLAIRAGSAADPAGKEGLAEFSTRLLRRGTRRRSADELNEAIEFVGAGLNAGSEEDATYLSLTSPSEHLGPMLEVLSEVIREPAFLEEELSNEKKRALAEFANDLDDPSLVADRALLRRLWPDHPYGHEVEGSPHSVRSFTRADVVDFHRKQMGPRVSTLFIIGSLELSDVAAKVERAFGAWSGGPAVERVTPGREKNPPTGVLIVDKPEQSQCQIRLGGVGFQRGHPDFFPAVLLNVALGAGFTSRLVNEIRVNRGLSYGASSRFDGLKSGGTFELSSFTKTETTEELIQVALAEVAKLRSKGLQAAELRNAQTYVAGLFPFRTETNEAYAGVLSDIQLYGLGDDYIERYPERLRAVKLRQTSEVAARYLFPHGVSIVVVGNASKVERKLKKFGPVEVRTVSEFE